MTEQDIVIRLKGVSKMYKLFNNKVDRMKEALHPLKKKYHKPFYALNNIDLEVKRGEILGIVGVNGSGKSTLLKIISGIIPATKGKVQVKGRVVPLLELGSGFNPEFTGLENIYFYNSIHGYTRKQTDAILDEILDFAEIGEFIHQPLKTYSSGMKARLAFAVSVNIDPDILILDEVLSVGDALFRRKAYTKMEKLIKDDNRTVLYVSHSDQSILQLCSRVILLNSGKIIMDGTPKLVTTYYQKLVFAKKENTKYVLEEIKKLSDQFTNNTLNNKSIQQSYSELEQDNISHQTDDNSIIDNQNDATQQQLKPYYIDGFKSKSQIKHKNLGVDIYNIKITTLDGLLVNHLIAGEKYYYEYNLKNRINDLQILAGMGIHDAKSLTLTGARSYLINIHANQILNIKWQFDCKLNSGIYYTHVAVRCLEENGESYIINRINDAFVFKVFSSNENIVGLVNLIDNLTMSEQNNSETI